MTSTRQLQIGGIVLAGASHWGETPLEQIGPRALLPVAGRPLVWYGLDWLRRGGIAWATVCANGHSATMRACLGDGDALGVGVDYCEDLMPRGPAGCIRDAAMRRAEDVFVVIEGALLLRADLRAIVRRHVDTGAVLTIVAVEEDAMPGSPGPLRPAGIYVVSRSALELVPEQGYQDIKEVWVPRLHAGGRRVVPFVISESAVIAVTGLGSYLRAATTTLDAAEAEANRANGYRRIDGAWVHRTARVAESARLSESVLVGPRACIESKVLIQERTIIGPGSRIGKGAILSEVVTWPGCQVGAGAILSRCLLLGGCMVEAGLVVRSTIYCGDSAERTALTGWTLADYWAMAPQKSLSIDEVSAPAVAGASLTQSGSRPAVAAVRTRSVGDPVADGVYSPSPV